MPIRADFLTIGPVAQIPRGDLLALIRKSLLSLNRLPAYHDTGGKPADGPNKDAAAWAKDLLQDIAALSDHATYLSNKTNFLLDATLGLINREQSQIIKIFSIAAVCLMPPTLAASSYGMNFRSMPEPDWLFRYTLSMTTSRLQLLTTPGACATNRHRHAPRFGVDGKREAKPGRSNARGTEQDCAV